MKIADQLVRSPAFQRARLSSLHNLVKSKNLKKYYQSLTDFYFLKAKINHPELGVQALINDYDLIDDPEVAEYPEYNYSKVKVLKLIQGALRLSAHILNEDKTQLVGQLLIRLQYFQIPEIQTILKQAIQSKAKPWLRPLSASLTPPGGRLLRTVTGHTGAVSVVQVTSNGKYLISASKDNTIKVWNLQTSEEFCTFSGHTDWVLSLAITPDSKQVISGSKDRTIKVWSLETRKELFTLKGHTRQINALAVTSDGKQVISGSEDSTFRIWDLKTKQEVFSSYTHGNYITALTIIPDSENIIFAISNTQIIVWSLLYSKRILTLKGHKDTVSGLAVTPDGKKLISGSWDKTLKIWNLGTTIFPFQRLLFTLKGHSNRITAVVITPDGKRIISDSLDNTLKVWDLHNIQELFPLKEHTDEINPLAVTPDGRWLISGSEDNSIKVWNLEETIEEKFIPLGHSNKVNALAVTSNNKYVISSSEDDTLKVWSLETGKELFTLNGIDSLSANQEKFLVLSDAGDLILLLDALSEIPAFKRVLAVFFTVYGLSGLINALPKSNFIIWNFQTQKVDFNSYKDRVLAVILKPGYKCLINKSCQYDSFKGFRAEISLQILNLFNKKHYILKNCDIRENPVVITPDGTKVISRSIEYNLTVWDLHTGKQIFSFPGYIPVIKGLIITPDGNWVIAYLANKTIKIWNIKYKKDVSTLKSSNDFVNTLVVTPDSKQLIYASLDKMIKIWDFKLRKEIINIQDEVNADTITVTLNGKWIISESLWEEFPRFKIWDILTGKEVFTLIHHDQNTLKVYNSSSGNIIASFSIEDELESFTLAPDGVTIIAGDELGVVHFFRLEGFTKSVENTSSIQKTLQEKSPNFIGREFVFTAINNFFKHYDRGYFTIIGAPGSGKSTILARYITENPEVFYYSAQVKGKNLAEEFLKTISTHIETSNDASLQVILQQISDKLESNQKFIIVIDSLDAIDYSSQTIGSNLFYLPRYLPKGIYFLLTRRPFLREKSGLLIEAPFQFLNLNDYPKENCEDIQTYIQQYLKEFLPSLYTIKEIFTKQLTNRSENNFMYVSQILTAIKTAFDSNKLSSTDIFNVTSLPDGLEAYYQQHLQKMFLSEQGEEFNSNAQAILNILLKNSSPISVEEISQIIDIDEYDVEEVLENWIEFLNLYEINGETRYSLYNSSFRNWLTQLQK